MNQGIVFDMDGVLFDTERLSNESFHIVAEKNNMTDYDIDQVAADCVGLNSNDMGAMFLEKYPKIDYKSFWPMIKEEFHILLEKELPLKPGAKEILVFLKEKGWIIGLASSSRYSSVISHLERSGLKEYFEVIIGGDMVEHSKPNPDIYLKACDLLHIEPAASYAVEDSKNGVKSAYAAGMKTIMVPDLIQPTEEMIPMIYHKYDSLFDFMEALR